MRVELDEHNQYVSIDSSIIVIDVNTSYKIGDIYSSTDSYGNIYSYRIIP